MNDQLSPSPSPSPGPASASGAGAGAVPVWGVIAAAVVALVVGIIGGQALFGNESAASEPEAAPPSTTGELEPSADTAAPTATVPTTTSAPTTTTEPPRVAEPGDWDDPLPLNTPASSPELQIVINSVDFGSHDMAMAGHPDHAQRVPADHRVILVDVTVTNTGDESYQGSAMADIHALGSSRRLHSDCRLIWFEGQINADMIGPGESMSGKHAVCVPEAEIEDRSLSIAITIWFDDILTFRAIDWAAVEASAA